MQLRNSKEVAKEDYNTFYKSTFKEFIDPQAYTHFSTEVYDLTRICLDSVLHLSFMSFFKREISSWQM